MKLYVGNLPYSMSETELSELFLPFGALQSTKIITDRYSGQSRGFGFVEMADRAEGQKAIDELHGKQINNRDLVVNEARPQENKASRW